MKPLSNTDKRAANHYSHNNSNTRATHLSSAARNNAYSQFLYFGDLCSIPPFISDIPASLIYTMDSKFSFGLACLSKLFLIHPLSPSPTLFLIYPFSPSFTYSLFLTYPLLFLYPFSFIYPFLFIPSHSFLSIYSFLIL